MLGGDINDPRWEVFAQKKNPDSFAELVRVDPWARCLRWTLWAWRSDHRVEDGRPFHWGLNWGSFSIFNRPVSAASNMEYHGSWCEKSIFRHPAFKKPCCSHSLDDEPHQIFWLLKHTGLFCMANLVGSCCKFPRSLVKGLRDTRLVLEA